MQVNLYFTTDHVVYRWHLGTRCSWAGEEQCACLCIRR
jgi:hypothetical protein